MKRVSKSKILDIINQIDNEMMQSEAEMSIYECFDFSEEDNKNIARYLSKAINLNYKQHNDILNNLISVIDYSSSVFPCLIIEELYKQKKLYKQKYKSLLNWADDAWFVRRSHYIPISKKELEELIKTSHHSITKQRIKDVLDMLYYDD